ncbi:MAG TPA: hypothetical protein VGO36_03545 [Solirubrobacterales bacterium]|jgi:hypothetical protein|nr:hypothetical protein [Solirubrobacterales bacterium]
MDPAELTRIFPRLITDYLEDATPPQPVQPGPLHEEFPSWSFINGSVLTVGAILPERGQLRVTAGLAMDVPYGPEVSHEVNRMNNKELLFGRMFLVGNEESGRGCILMQEIVLADGLDEEHLPSLQNLLRIVATLGGQGSRLAPELRERFGGQPFTEEQAFFLQMSG